MAKHEADKAAKAQAADAPTVEEHDIIQQLPSPGQPAWYDVDVPVSPHSAEIDPPEFPFGATA